ncbi:MAG: hypothetical protein ACRD15_17765 [Vicinamibacterales bacterium]
MAAIDDLVAFQRAADTTLGRFTGPVPFYSTTNTFAAPNTIRVPNPVPLSKALESILVVLRFRLAITVANYTVGVPEAPQTLLERLVVRGNHSRLGGQIPIDISGATAFVWPNLSTPFATNLRMGATYARSADPGQPFVQTLGLSTGAIGSYDVEVVYQIPVGPFLGNGATEIRSLMPFLWRAEDWGDSLQVELQLGDRTSLGTPAGTTVTTWTAYGSAAGSPSVEVFLNYSLMGQLSGIGQGGFLVRTEQAAVPALTGIATDQQLGSFLRRAVTTRVLTKSGILLAGTSAGVTVFGSLSDLQLDRTRLVVDQKAIRDTARNYAMKAYLQRMFGCVHPEGYFDLDFCESGNPLLALRLDQSPPGVQAMLRTDVLTANAANRQNIVQEYVIGGPF